MKAKDYYSNLNDVIGYIISSKDYLKQKRRNLNQLKKYTGLTNKEVLDVGCGNGVLLNTFVNNQIKSYFGVDVSKPMLIACAVEKTHIKTKKDIDFTLSQVDLEKENLPFREDSFDVVFSQAVLTYVKNTPKVLEDMIRVLKPGGFLCFNTAIYMGKSKNFKIGSFHVDVFLRSNNHIESIIKKANMEIVWQKIEPANVSGEFYINIIAQKR